MKAHVVRLIAFILLLSLLQGCSNKYVQKFKNVFRSQPIHKKVAHKERVVHKKRSLFPVTKRFGLPIPQKAVQIYESVKVPKHCRIDGWMSFYIPGGIVYKSTFLPDIVKAKKKEKSIMRQTAARNGIRYVYSYMDTRKIRYSYTFDPILKRKFKVILTPFKRIMVHKNRIYREAVRILRCKKLP